MPEGDGPHEATEREGSPAGGAREYETGEPSVGPQGAFAATTSSLDRALTLVSVLRDRDEWDRRQTARTLVPHLLEEAHEAADAIRDGDATSISAELGDLLLNVAFQIVVAEETGAFDREAVVQGLERKMIRRHPHIFGDGRVQDWESLKAADRTADEDGESALEGVSAGLPPLVRAHRIQQRAARVGFDWDEPDEALAKVREEAAEVAEAIRGGNPNVVEEEIGDLLFAVVNVARLAGSHAHVAMEAATAKFERRFRALEALATQRGVALPGASLQALDELWDEVKAAER